MGPKKRNNKNKQGGGNNQQQKKPLDASNDLTISNSSVEDLTTSTNSLIIDDSNNNVIIEKEEKEDKVEILIESVVDTAEINNQKQQKEKKEEEDEGDKEEGDKITIEKLYGLVKNVANDVCGIKEKVVDNADLVDWKYMYLLVQKELQSERNKTELLESQVVEFDQEKRLLNERIRVLENHLENERKKLNKTFGTIRSGTVRLMNTVRLGASISGTGGTPDMSTILKDLQQNIENIDDNEVLNNKLGENADALLTKLNSFNDPNTMLTSPLAGSSGDVFTHPTAIRLSQTEGDEAADKYDKDAELKIIKVQSYVRRWLAAKRFKRLKTKRSAVNELFETETTFVQHMSNLIKIFVNPLKQKMQNGEIQMSVNEVEKVFSTVNTIFMSNSIFLKQTEDIFKHFNKWSLIGSRMLEQLPLFECYIDYIINFEYSQLALKRCLATPSFTQFVKSAETNYELGDLDLADLLIMPVQRVPRYIMLIQHIRKFTPVEHADYAPLSRALDAFKKFADGINERKGSRHRAVQLDDRIVGLKEDIASKPGRYLVREGPLRFKKNNEYVFLLNDMMLICHPQVKKAKQRSGSTSSSSPSTSSASLSTSLPANLSTSSSPSSSSSSSSKDKDEVHEIITYKFITKVQLDARVKIVEDSQEPKFSTIVPDIYSIELTAPSTEERSLWVKDIITIVTIFSNNLLNNPNPTNNIVPQIKQ